MASSDIDETRCEVLAVLARRGAANTTEILEDLNRTRRVTPAALDVAMWGLTSDERIRSTQRDGVTCWELRP